MNIKKAIILTLYPALAKYKVMYKKAFSVTLCILFRAKKVKQIAATSSHRYEFQEDKEECYRACADSIAGLDDLECVRFSTPMLPSEIQVCWSVMAH